MGGEWKRTTIDELCQSNIADIQTGPFGSQLHAHDYTSFGVPVVPTEAIRNRRIDHSVLPKISEEKANALARHRLAEGDILFARRGAQATGHVAYVGKKEQSFICGTGAIRLRLDTRQQCVRSDFLSHVIASPVSLAWFKFHAIGATMPNLNEGIIRSFPLDLPPVAEQAVIACLLGALDDKIELNRRMAETLEAMARALFKSWFVDFDPVHARAERRPTGLPDDLAALFPDSFGDDGIPGKWTTCTLGDVLELAYGRSLPSSMRRDGIVPVYGSGGITGFHDNALVPGPGIIIGRKGTVGTLYWEQNGFFPIDTVFYVRPKQATLSYLWYLLATLGLHHLNTDAAVPGLNRENVYRLKIVLPTPEVRNAFEAVVEPFDSKRHAIVQQSRTLAVLRDTLLPKLISGELRIADAEQHVAAA